MDFEKLLKFASTEQKTREKKPPPKKYSTQLGPAKREAPKPKGVQSEAVKAFLEKKEQEERERQTAERKKKQGLIDARREANTLRKAEAIYKRSKEHKVDLELEDDDREEQRDDGAKAKATGDDGEDMLVEFKKNNIRVAAVGMSTSQRYRLAQEKSKMKQDRAREKEKQSIVEKSKALSLELSRTPKTIKHSSKSKSVAVHVQKPTVGVSVPVKNKSQFKVKKKPDKPPLSFEELIKLAQKKNDGEEENAKEKKKKNPNSRPRTQEEKEREERKKTKEYRQWYLHGGKHYGGDKETDTPTPEKKKDSSKRPNSSTNDRTNETPGKPKGPSVTNGSGARANPMKNNSVNRPDQRVPNMPQKSTTTVPPGRGIAGNQGKNMKAQQKQPSSQSRKYGETGNNVLKCGPAGGDSESEEEEEPQLSVWDRINRENAKFRPRQEKRKKRPGVIDSESEYDEEMEDFIDEDDGDMDDFIDDSGAVDISSQIREIFGYDRRKFRHETEDDLRGMESSFSSQMKEEARSARLGAKEDIEEQRKEEEHAKRKLMMKKNKKLKR